MSIGFFARAVIVGLSIPIGISLACSQSPSAPTPPAAVPARPIAPVPDILEGISLSASPGVVSSGAQLTLMWSAPSGRGCSGGGDWVALFTVGDPDNTGAANGHSDLWFLHLCGATSGTSPLSAPLQPGEYEFRYMVGSTAVARSSPVTVNAAASPAVLASTLSVDGGTASTRQIGDTFSVAGSGYTAGRTVTRYIDPAVNGSTMLTPLTADGLGHVSWAFTPTCSNSQPTVAIYAVDDTTGRTSNTITETVTGSASCPKTAIVLPR
jgi:hypothetical protein